MKTKNYFVLVIIAMLLVSPVYSASVYLNDVNNNFPLSLSVTGTLIKTITIERYGLSDLVASFNDMTVNNTVASLTAIKLNTSYTPPSNLAGQLYWNNNDLTLNIDTGTGQTLNVGQENYIRALNKDFAVIPNGRAVFINGAQGNRPTISLANNTVDSASYVVGVATQDITQNNEGFITTFGLVHDLDTSNWTVGSILYLNGNGTLTNSSPIHPLHSVQVGIVLVSNPSNGVILIHIRNGYEMTELHDVSNTAPTNNQVLLYNSTSTLYEPRSFNFDTLRTINNTITGNITFNGQDNPLVFNGNSTYWLDVPVNGLSLASGVNAPTLTNWNGSLAQVPCFKGATQNDFASGTIELPHNWKEGSAVSPHIHVARNSSTAGNYTFNMDGFFMNASDGKTVFYNQNITVTTGSISQIQIIELPDVTPTGFVTGSTFTFRVTRLQDASTDTYAGCVGLFQASLHYESDSLGSASEFGKWS